MVARECVGQDATNSVANVTIHNSHHQLHLREHDVKQMVAISFLSGDAASFVANATCHNLLHQLHLSSHGVKQMVAIIYSFQQLNTEVWNGSSSGSC